MVSFFYRIQPEKITVIPNGVDFKIFSACKTRTPLAGDPAILWVSRVCPLKGFFTLVEAVDRIRNELPHMKVHLLGDAAQEYQEFAKKKGVDEFFIFHGRVSHSLIPKYLKSADFGIYGSIVYEGFGIALVEAMASGLPVIASDIDTYRQIVTDGKDGLLFKKADADALSNAIILMNQDSVFRKKLSKNAQVSAAKYDWEKIAAEYASLYKSLC
jgi:phosphatidylinositol alpha-mannosyltransferase